VIAVEQVWEKLSQRFSFSLLCGYPITQFENSGREHFFRHVCGIHSTVIPPDAYTSLAKGQKILEALAKDVQ